MHNEAGTDIQSGWRTIVIQEAILSKNTRLAEANRALFQAQGLLVLNVLSSPGSGKTALLERTLSDPRYRARMAVIVGDPETDNDARRLSGKGAPVVQLTTSGYCHLDAGMVARAVEQIDLSDRNTLFIENVGNLVCPAAFDLGERLRVALLSVTEGEDKPLKYPTAYQSADAVVVTKTDLAEAVEFDRETALANIRRVAPRAALLEVSARTGHGMGAWYDWIEARRDERVLEERNAPGCRNTT